MRPRRTITEPRGADTTARQIPAISSKAPWLIRQGAAALAITALLATAAPAQAENQAGRLLAGIAGVAILATILDAERKRANAAPSRNVAPVLRQPTPLYGNPPAPAPHWNRGSGVTANGAPGYRRCQRQRWTRNGWVSYLAPKCVARVNARRAKNRGRIVTRY